MSPTRKRRDSFFLPFRTLLETKAISCMTLIFRDPLFQMHETGQHPERPQRLASIEGQLAKTGLLSMCVPGSYQPANVHSPAQLRRVSELSEQGGGFLDGDTILSPQSYEVALAAVGVCVSAVDAVMAGESKTALCLVRPPGHHANQERSMGFCLFNNIALAAQHARSAHGLSRILIVDWDVHHGNGTQDIFYEDSEITFFSIHRYGYGFYPRTGAADETGTGVGAGATFNIPVDHNISQKDYHANFVYELEKVADKIKPELVLLSAGFDAHRRDPIGSLCLESEDFGQMTRDVYEIARTHAQGRLISCLEGGYNLVALAESVQAHLEELLHVEGEAD